MKLNFYLFIICLLISFISQGQTTEQVISGEVTFVTSQNVYVRFENTDMIHEGDTLHQAGSTIPCLRVIHKSSSSCVCTSIGGCDVSKGDQIIFITRIIQTQSAEDLAVDSTRADILPAQPMNEPTRYPERITGRISAASYINHASDRENRHRVMSRLSLQAEHINHSNFSLETYLSYQNILTPGEASLNVTSSYFRIYNFAVKYEANPELSFILGRKINPKTASLGALDGIQVEKYFNSNYIGLIAGLRPDISDFAFNTDLLQYGAYIGRETRGKNTSAQTTLGIIEQRNAGAIDRRYAYFQHASTIGGNLNLFSSMELDLYNAYNNEVRLTNLFISGRYRFSRKLNMMVSYDSRKRIVYYHTFQTEIERLLDDDLARQGIRLRINVKPLKHVATGVSFSKRYQSDSENKSDNIYGYLTFSKLPSIGGRLSVSYNQNKSNYSESNIITVRHSRDMVKKKLYGDFYIRIMDFDYSGLENSRKQQYYGINLVFNASRTFSLSLLGELATFDSENNSRIFTKISKRFHQIRK